jgi:hypothetical protein
MVQMLSGLITYLLLAIYCREQHDENVSIKRVRELRIKIQNETLDANSNFSPNDDLNFKVDFNIETYNVELSFDVLSVPKGLPSNKGFKKGDSILVSTSRKPYLNDFRKEMDARFDGKMYVSKDKTFAGFIGKPK